MSKEKSSRRTISEYLKGKGWLVVPYPNMGYGRKGFPDLFAIKDGRIVFIETKATKGKTEKLQEYEHEQLRRRGMTVVVARSVADLTPIDP